MSPIRIIGLVCIVVGVVLIVLGLRATESVADRLSSFFTGHFTEATVWYILGGIALGVTGVVLLATSARSVSP